MTFEEASGGIALFARHRSQKVSTEYLARNFLKSGMGGFVNCTTSEDVDCWQGLIAAAGRMNDIIRITPDGDNSVNVLEQSEALAMLIEASQIERYDQDQQRGHQHHQPALSRIAVHQMGKPRRT